MPHVVLLGDSIFDNAPYTDGGPDVISQLRALLPAGWGASLLAIDGATTDDVAGQVERLPGDATHLVLSVGGNNALLEASVLDMPASSMAQAVGLLADVAAAFETRYRAAVAACLRPGLPLSVCTIYNGCFPDAAYQRIVSVALMVFNDAILRVAIGHGLPVVDLRLVCTDALDYANPIEPSVAGGGKIARLIAGLMTGANADARATRVVTG